MNRAVLLPALFAISAFAPSEKQAGMEEFIAISDGKRVFVNWTSSNDRNYDYFTIEKSKDGVNFSASLIVKGVGGAPGLEYFDCDYAPYEGMSYYRLKQTDYYGDYVYSGVVPVNFQLLKDGAVITVPKLPDTSELEELQTRETLVVLQDKQGARHVSKVRVGMKENLLYILENKTPLPQGSYQVIASSNNRLFNQTLHVQ